MVKEGLTDDQSVALRALHLGLHFIASLLISAPTRRYYTADATS